MDSKNTLPRAVDTPLETGKKANLCLEEWFFLSVVLSNSNIAKIVRSGSLFITLKLRAKRIDHLKWKLNADLI